MILCVAFDGCLSFGSFQDVTGQLMIQMNEIGDVPREPIKVMVWIRTISVRRRPRVTCIRAHVPKRPITRIRTQHSIPNRREIGKCDVEWWVLCVKRNQTIKNGLEPRFAPGVMDASTVSVGNQEIASVGRGLGEEGYLAEEILR